MARTYPVTPTSVAAGSQAGCPTRRLLSPAEFERMGAAGLFRGEKVELLFGEVFSQVTPMSSEHAAAIQRVVGLVRTISFPGPPLRGSKSFPARTPACGRG